MVTVNININNGKSWSLRMPRQLKCITKMKLKFHMKTGLKLMNMLNKKHTQQIEIKQESLTVFLISCVQLLCCCSKPNLTL